MNAVRRNSNVDVFVLSIILVAVTLAVYWPVQTFDFVNYDDPIYLTENPAVQSGLSWQGIRWSFSTFHAGNWHPLTWLSHMADFSLYRFSSGGHHWTNLQIHLLNVLLLFLVLRGMTGATVCSAGVSMLFAIHPLHVESVAWVSERKDVLSGFFWILTMGSYSHYVKRSTILRYSLVLLFFICGLLSKPMAVTLPFALLLLDYWPLRRHAHAATVFDPFLLRFKVFKEKPAFRLAVEKIPMIMLLTASCVVTVLAQKAAGAVVPIEAADLSHRFANAAVSYLEYIRKMFWPYDLGVLYPYRGVIPPWHIGAASSVLAGVSVVAFWQARSRPYLLVGWLWFIGTLVPVIGIVQVGAQAMADRYTYIPLIGLFMGISWMVQTVTARNTWLKRSAFVAVLLLCIGCVSLTRMQVGTWKNSFTLYQHALEVVPENPVALNNLGVLCLEAGILEKAVSFFRKAVDLAPHYQDAWVNMGAAALRTENLDEADRCLLQASRIDVHHTNLRMNIGILMLRRGFPDEAEREFRYVLALNPYHEVAHHRLGALLFHQGRLDESHELLQATIRINPFNAEAYNNLGVVLRKKGKLDEAILMFQKALDLDPGNPHYERNIRSVRFDDGGKSLSNHKRENPWTS